MVWAVGLQGCRSGIWGCNLECEGWVFVVYLFCRGGTPIIETASHISSGLQGATYIYIYINNIYVCICIFLGSRFRVLGFWQVHKGLFRNIGEWICWGVAMGLVLRPRILYVKYRHECHNWFE